MLRKNNYIAVRKFQVVKTVEETSRS